MTGGPFGLGVASASLDVQLVRVTSPSYAEMAVRSARANAATTVAPDVEHILQMRERVKIDRYYGLTAPTRDAVLSIAPGALFRCDDASNSNPIHSHTGTRGTASSSTASGLARTESMRIRHYLREHTKMSEEEIAAEVAVTPSHPVRPFTMADSGAVSARTRATIRAITGLHGWRAKAFERNVAFAVVRAKGVQRKHCVRVFKVGVEVRRVRNSEEDEAVMEGMRVA